MPQFHAPTHSRALLSRAFLTATLATVVAFGSAGRARAQEVVVMVDGQPITQLDIDHRAKFIEMSTRKAPARQEVINSLIDEILEIREGKRFSVDPGAADVNDQFNTVAHNMGVDGEKLEQMLTSGGASPDTLKQKLKAQMIWGNLIRGRYKASLEIPDSDIEAQLQLHKNDSGNTTTQTGYDYTLRPVLLVVQRGSPEAAFEARKRDADALRARFNSCDDGIAFVRGLPDAAVRDQVVKSSLDLPQELRDILEKAGVGHLTPPEQTAEGIQMFAVCSRKETKNETPETKKMREEIFEKKFGARARRYLAELRKSAMIEYKTSQTEPPKNAPKTK
jgi:peptidyl-prolyl cis-trans isomerase SurA